MRDEIKSVKCVIFDFDGVLADTETGRFDQLAEILNERGIDLKKRLKREQLIGLSTSAFFRKYFPEFSEKDIEELSLIRHMEYIGNLEKYCIPYPQVKATVEFFKKKGFTLILATANDTKSAHLLLNHVGVAPMFESIYGREIMEDSNGQKQYIFLRDKLNFLTEECVVIEDSLVGVSASKRAGFFTIAMNRYDDETVKNTADVWVNDYNELTGVFDIN